jgi:hypothetical protein
MPQYPGTLNEGYLIRASQCREGVQTLCNQSGVHFRATKRPKCSLAFRKNKNLLMFISPSYILTCTLQNGMYFSLKNRDVFTQREAKASFWSEARNTRPCPWVSPSAVSKPDQSILTAYGLSFNFTSFREKVQNASNPCVTQNINLIALYNFYMKYFLVTVNVQETERQFLTHAKRYRYGSSLYSNRFVYLMNEHQGQWSEK